MTVGDALDVGVVGVSTAGTSALALSRGAAMDQWLIWAVSTILGASAAYGTFRVTTERRLSTLEANAHLGATSQELAVLQGQINVLMQEQAHRKEMFDRMDRRIESIAVKVGAL